MNRIYQITIAFLIVVIVYLLWQNNGQVKKDAAVSPSSFQKNTQQYPLLSARILQEYHNDILINFVPLRKKLHEVTRLYGNSFAFYFEYLPTGTSIGMNQNGDFALASLIKLPIIMAYYRMRDRMGLTDDPEVIIVEDDLDKDFGTLWKRGVGAKIRLSEAVRLAIVDSDNTAARIVARQVPDEDFEAVYDGLDIDLQMKDLGGAVIQAKQYSSIIKALYFSSVLPKEDSQTILDLMTKTKFMEKIPSALPKDIPVAHKVGILGTALYSDCGIVYVPQRPYLLCVVSATDEKEATMRIRTVSKMIYDFVSAVNR